ncbi:hypothetical protein M413DRAFT_446132 [Hebeloma cylindrosporum]|uniref:Aldose 1-epimerase n=1 Tax=Hebeloma cylindrosporum TaxID=76867 RepID=A0A0C3C949_HEBCY|nr:hypothetical protein M413DRAFT_446132 [Hebeloma cylindrosporum h7]
MSDFNPVLITLPDSLTPALALKILPYGLTIHKILVQNDGRTHDIVIGPESPQGHVTQKYTNSIVGRYANRIPVGKHALERNGFSSEFVALPNESPHVSLHGGPVGFDALPWTHLCGDTTPELFSSSEMTRIHALPESSYAIFRLKSPSGDQGFPGTLSVEALIALVGPEKTRPLSEYSLGSIVLVYRAKLEDSNVVTPINLTQHWGFNLDASLRLETEPLSIKGHSLTIKADRVAELSSNALATGRFLSVLDLPAHDHTSKAVAENMPPGGYDDYYLFEEAANRSAPTRFSLSSFSDSSDYLRDLLRASDDEERGVRADPCVILSSERSGLKLEFDTNQRGVMFYTNAMANPADGARKKIHGGSGTSGNGDAYGPASAAFLEFHNPISSFLFDENKDGEDTLLTPDEMYHHYVRCDVKFKSS